MACSRIIITQFGGPEVLQAIEETSLPEPQFGEDRIRVLVTSASFTDTMNRKGKYPNLKQKPPFSLGHDMIGVVDKVGPDASRFKIGQILSRVAQVQSGQRILIHGAGGILVAFGFQNSILGKGGNIPLDFIYLKLWDMLPNHRSTSFCSIEAMRRKHPDWFTEDLAQLFTWLKNGKIKPVIAAKMPLAEAKQVHQLIEQAGVQGKIVLMVRADA